MSGLAVSGLVVSGLAVTLAGRPVLHDVDLTVRPGELVGLIGPNGAGKTTLLRAVLGLLPASAGTVVVDGRPPTAARDLLGYVPQRHDVDWDFPLDVRSAVLNRLVAPRGPLGRRTAAARAQDRERVAQALGLVGLTDLARRPVGQLSGGQRQRVLLARALVTRPAVLLLDEPYTGLDAPTSQLLTALVADLAADGRAVLLTTHDLSVAATTCSRICLLQRTVLADEAPADLVGHPAWMQLFGVPA